MNDLEHDLRTLLDEKASAAGAPEPDPRLLRRARRRQVGTMLAGVAMVAAILGGVVVAVSALGPGENGTPADPTGPLVDTTVNGVTVTHPQSWQVVDPVEAGIQPETQTTTRLILLMTDADPITAEAISCPALTDDERRDGVVMTIQQTPLALAGEAAKPWPVELVPLAPASGDATEVGPSGCFPGWTFLRASWTDGGRSFEARVGLGPDVSEGSRQALLDAFTGMRFEPAEGEARSAVLATGTAAGEAWELIAERQADGLSLSLQGETWGSGSGGFEDLPLLLQTGFHIFGEGEGREVVVFGAVREPGVRVEAFPVLGGPAVSAPVIDVPDQIGGDLDAFVLTYRPDLPELGVDLNLYDADDQILTTVELRPRGDLGDGDAGTAVPPQVVSTGEIDGHLWWLLDVGSNELQLTEDTRGDFTGDLGSDADLVVLMTAGRTPDPVLSFGAHVFHDDAGPVATFVFGVVSEEASWVIFSGTEGPVRAETADLVEGLRAYWLVLRPGGLDGQVAAVDADCSVLQAVQLSTSEAPTATAKPICPPSGA